MKTAVIGAVEYAISTAEDNTINARYISTGSMALGEGIICTGKAKGDTSNGFPGRYEIEYFGTDGNTVGIFDWEIERAGGAYRLVWKLQADGGFIPGKKGDIVFQGFGFPNNETSIVVAYWMTEEISSLFLGGA